MDDSPLLLDLKCPRRTIVFYVTGTAPLLGLVLAMWFLGGHDREQKLLLVLMGVLFVLPAAYGLQERLRLSRREIQQRYFGIWRTRLLPEKIRFEPRPDRTAPGTYDSLCRKVLRAPQGILIVNVATGKRFAQVSFGLLAGMSDREYRALLSRLNREANRPKR